ncbi:MAG TPA: MBL fold metallo-hydrolase [Terracidiphilus sp.]|jgi:glyoxylase-like metal-dependent hydrolase (beta-lactamase superfamily II)/rhodanese-related sulfurtransferase|nr:MBL fold metallo-hydrolase [Terracidiphilus sp.]
MEPVQFERFYLGCLAHASYMVASEGIAAVIDPQRDVDIYVHAAADKGWKIEHIIETHLHADFVSGHHELAERTGARIYLGAGSGAQFEHVPVVDGDEIRFGSCSLRFLQTPGHTLESTCILLKDAGAPDRPADLFTGDTLFVGDVGRPDLSGTYTPQELAEMLFHSLHEKLLTLPDDTRIFPAHGAGSLCGRQLGTESFSTIGDQKRTNYALMARTSEDFIHLLTDNLAAAPEYFAQDVDLNRRGAAPLTGLPGLVALSAAATARMQDSGAIVLDTRPAAGFAAGHVPGSVHISLTGQYASWAARILGLSPTIVVVSEDVDGARESQLRLARVGIEHVAGYLDGGISGWIGGGYALESIPQLTASDLATLCQTDANHVTVLDVRESLEREGGVIDGSQWIPLGMLTSKTAELDRGKLLVVHCKGGYRSSIAASLLRRSGFNEVANLIGGFDAWKAAGLPAASPPVNQPA